MYGATSKPINKGPLELAMSNIWGNPLGLKFTQTDKQTFQIFFDKECDLIRILQGGPWVYRNSWLVLRRWQRDWQNSTMNFDEVNIWVQLWGFPSHCKSLKLGTKVGETLGKVLDVGFFELPEQRNSIIKVKVVFNLQNYIKKGTNIGSNKDGIHWIDFRYERLPQFCYRCGIVGHDNDQCPSAPIPGSDAQNENLPFGPWIKANQSGRRVTVNQGKEDSNMFGGFKKMESNEITKVESDFLLNKLKSLSVQEGNSESSSTTTDMIVSAVDNNISNVAPGTNSDPDHGGNSPISTPVPVCGRLRQKGIDVSPLCPLCDTEIESVLHALLGCSKLENIWKRANLPFVEELDVDISFIDWFACALTQWNSDQLCNFAIISFKLWNRRNELRLNLRSVPLERILQQALDLWKEISDLHVASSSPAPSSSPTPRWRPPSMFFFKVNSDASLMNDSLAGAGCVIRNHDGRVLAALAKQLPASNSVAQLEAEAIFLGLEMGRDLGIRKVLVEGDSEWVMTQIGKGHDAFSHIGTIFDNIESLLFDFSHVEFAWVPRDANKVAHRLAQVGCTLESSQVWLEDNPSVISDVLALDGF